MNKINSIFGLQQKSDHIEKVNVESISPNPFQPRQFFDKENLEELASSIKEYGVLQPILLRKVSSKDYQLIAGERRYRASLLAGLQEIPAIIKDMDDHQVAEIAIIENLQRENLNYFEEAEGFKKLIEQFSMTQEEVAKKVGKSQSMIANKLRLLKLPAVVKNQVSTEVVTERHLRALLKLESSADQLFVLNKIYQDNLNVKQTEFLINNILSQANESKECVDKDQNIEKDNDYRLYKNTIKKSLEAIEYGGAKTQYKEKIYSDHLEIKIKIYK